MKFLGLPLKESDANVRRNRVKATAVNNPCATMLRVHLKSIGTPILCDSLYGRRSSITLSEIETGKRMKGDEPILSRPALHAEAIRFRHPREGGWVEFSSPMPEDIERTLRAIRGRSPFPGTRPRSRDR